MRRSSASSLRVTRSGAECFIPCTTRCPTAPIDANRARRSSQSSRNAIAPRWSPVASRRTARGPSAESSTVKLVPLDPIRSSFPPIRRGGDSPASYTAKRRLEDPPLIARTRVWPIAGLGVVAPSGQAVVEIPAHVSHQLSIGRVVDRLDARDLRLERRIVLLQVSEEVKLRHRRPEQQNLVCTHQLGRHLVEEPVLVVRMVVGPGLLVLRAAMEVVVRGRNRRLIEGGGGDMKNLRLVVIDPDGEFLHAALL